MAQPTPNREVRGAPPRVDDHEAVHQLPHRQKTSGDAARPPHYVVRLAGLPEVERPSLHLMERVLIALKALPSVAE